MRKPCENFVETYGEMVIQYLTSSADPQEICTELGLCSAAGGGSRNSDNNDDSTVAMGKCQLCMVLSDYLSAMLDDPRVDTSIDEIVEKVCPVLPRKYRVGVSLVEHLFLSFQQCPVLVFLTVIFLILFPVQGND